MVNLFNNLFTYRKAHVYNARHNSGEASLLLLCRCWGRFGSTSRWHYSQATASFGKDSVCFPLKETILVYVNVIIVLKCSPIFCKIGRFFCTHLTVMTFQFTGALLFTSWIDHKWLKITDVLLITLHCKNYKPMAYRTNYA
jgi:hypothetical protein